MSIHPFLDPYLPEKLRGEKYLFSLLPPNNWTIFFGPPSYATDYIYVCVCIFIYSDTQELINIWTKGRCRLRSHKMLSSYIAQKIRFNSQFSFQIADLYFISH